MSNKREMKRINSYSELKEQLKSAYYNKPNTYGEEGVDHINISLTSTGIGRMLDPAYRTKFDYPIIGPFKSILGMMYWLKDPERNDLFRDIKIKDLQSVVKQSKLVGIKNYNVILLHATMIKVRNNAKLIEEIKALPDDIAVLAYRINRGTKLRITTEYAKTIIPVIQEVISSIKEDREPNYKKFSRGQVTVENGFIDDIFPSTGEPEQPSEQEE